MDDYASTTVLCPLGHGLFIMPARSPQRQCPNCGELLIDVADENPICGLRFLPARHCDLAAVPLEFPAMSSSPAAALA